MENAVYLENLGGEIPWVAISAKTGKGVDELLDLILLVAEVQEHKADATIPAEGYVIEANRDQKRGIAATLIITKGTLSSGMVVRAGNAIAPVRIMEDHLGKALKVATFSTPVRLIGFDTLPEAGLEFFSYKNKREAETARDAAQSAPVSTQFRKTVGTDKDHHAMPVIVRADTTGSLEAIVHELLKLTTDRASIAIVQSGIGNISENDVKLAHSTPDKPTLIVGFNVSADPIAHTIALQQKVPVETFTIIYKLTERLEELMIATTPKRTVEEVVGRARIIRQFSSQKTEHVVGGAITEGYLAKGGSVRVLRRSTVIGVGKIKNLQAHKQNTSRVEAPAEFGTQIEAVFEIAEGDTLEHFTTTIQ